MTLYNANPVEEKLTITLNGVLMTGSFKQIDTLLKSLDMCLEDVGLHFSESTGKVIPVRDMRVPYLRNAILKMLQTSAENAVNHVKAMHDLTNDELLDVLEVFEDMEEGQLPALIDEFHRKVTSH